MAAPSDHSTTRRALLTAVAGLATGLAGCQVGGTDATPSDGDAPTPEPEAPTATERAGTTPTEEQTPTETADGCVVGRRRIERSMSVDGAWAQFQAGPAKTGHVADVTGPTDPSLAWRHATCDRLAEAPPVVAGGSIYVGGGSLRAFDAGTGELEWRRGGFASPTAPAVAEDTVYFAGRDLVALDRTDGSVRWRLQRQSDILASSSPTLANGTLYVPGAVDDPTLRAFEAATGRRRWTLSLDGEFGPSPPAVAGDRVHVTDDGDRLLSVGTDGGDVQVLAGGPDDAGVFSPPAVADGTVYVGGLEGKVRAFDAATGERRWARRLSESGIPGPPVVADDHLYVVESGAVHALTTDGETVWERPGERYGLPVRAGDTLYVGGSAGSNAGADGPAGVVAALDVADGRERWRVTTRGFRSDGGGDLRAGTRSPVAVADGVVFAATGAGDLLAFS